MLFNEGNVSISRFAEILRLHPQLLDDVLAKMQQEHLVEVAKTGGLGRLSYSYALTDAGTKRARDAFERSQYIGPAPVDVESYKAAINFQTSKRMSITPDEVKNALKEISESEMGKEGDSVSFDVIPIQPYSTDISCAWKLIDELKDDHIFHIHNEEKYGWVIELGGWGGENPTVMGHKLTAPHAICLAALKAVGYTND